MKPQGLGLLPIVFGMENLENITEVFVNDFFGFIAWSLWFPLIPFWDSIQAPKLKSSGNDPKGNVTEDLGYVFPNFPSKDNGQRSHPLRFCLRDCTLNKETESDFYENLYSFSSSEEKFFMMFE